jgi:hypothetical protein
VTAGDTGGTGADGARSLLLAAACVPLHGLLAVLLPGAPGWPFDVVKMPSTLLVLAVARLAHVPLRPVRRAVRLVADPTSAGPTSAGAGSGTVSERTVSERDRR